LRNPYSKKKKQKKRNKTPEKPPPSPASSLSDNEDLEDENLPSTVSITAAEELPPTPPPAALSPRCPVSATSVLPASAPTIPPLPSNSVDGSINFYAIPPPTAEFTLPGILQTIANHQLRAGPNALAVDINDLQYNTSEYEKAKTKQINEFFQVLTEDPEAHSLADIIVNPANPCMKKRRLYILCQAPSTPEKKRILNYALLIYSLKYVKVSYRGKDLSKCPKLYADAQYEPGTAKTAFKMLFRRFQQEGIVYSQSKDFNGTGKNVIFVVGRLFCQRATLLSC
jgi:hypothetical protein